MTNLVHRNPTVVIRAARGSDGPALEQLAELDSQARLAGDALVAEQDGELVAAVSDGRVIADPFRPTADVVALLRLRAAPARGSRPGRKLVARRLRVA